MRKQTFSCFVGKTQTGPPTLEISLAISRSMGDVHILGPCQDSLETMAEPTGQQTKPPFSKAPAF